MSASMGFMFEHTLFCTDASQVAKSVRILSEANCCPRCIFRLLGEKDQDTYRNNTVLELTDKLKHMINCDLNGEETDKHTTSFKESPCAVCVGVLQDEFCSETFLEQIRQKIVDEGYEYDDYLCSITLPVTLLIRQHSLWVLLRSSLSEVYSDISLDDVVPIKDVWKWINGPTLGLLLKVPFSLQSGFEITLFFTHDELENECSFLYDLYPNIFRKRKYGKYTRKYKLEVFNRTNVSKALNDTSDEKFKQFSKCPPKKLSSVCKCSEIRYCHSSVFLAGRYNKYSRTLSQTPWVVDGHRKTESSVQELICEKLIERIRPDEHRFSSSGREDVDVRMLGRGRPFIVEFVNPRVTNISQEELTGLQKAVNSCTRDVRVRDLQRIKKEETCVLKEGEEDKTKSYLAQCWCQPAITQSELDKLSTMKDIALKQKTPVRVLHRRALLFRDRMVHSLSAQLVDDHHFNLTLVTQAGTYVKEFVHGDFGRTQPNLNTILGRECDILELDVKSVDVSWPKCIDTDEECQDANSEEPFDKKI